MVTSWSGRRPVRAPDCGHDLAAGEGPLHARLNDQDVFFSLWRLRWFAHALSTSPADLFNGNVFYPERGVLAFSDAMLVQGILATPLLWAGIPPVLVYNLMLLGAIVASGVGMFVLARHLTGSTAGAVIAGVVFAFAPYRFDHYHHLELQWTVWSPWAFWALQRSIETRLLRFGLLMGVFAALQLLSSVYYGAFLVMVMAAVAFTQLIPLRGRELVRSACCVALSGAIVVPVAALYSLPYPRRPPGLASGRQAKPLPSARGRETMPPPRRPTFYTGLASSACRSVACFPGLSLHSSRWSDCCSSGRHRWRFRT